jgi:hypothetical protein
VYAPDGFCKRDISSLSSFAGFIRICKLFKRLSRKAKKSSQNIKKISGLPPRCFIVQTASLKLDRLLLMVNLITRATGWPIAPARYAPEPKRR